MAASQTQRTTEIHPEADPSLRLVAHNVRRLMAREGLSYDGLVEATGLDARTVRAVMRAEGEPRSSTLQRLAQGLGVETDDLFAPPVGLTPAAFDVATNPAVEAVREKHPHVFAGWKGADFAELASRFGVGGRLTEAGALDAAHAMNRKREVLARAGVIMETSHADFLSRFIDLLYDQIRVEQ